MGVQCLGLRGLPLLEGVLSAVVGTTEFTPLREFAICTVAG